MLDLHIGTTRPHRQVDKALCTMKCGRETTVGYKAMCVCLCTCVSVYLLAVGGLANLIEISLYRFTNFTDLSVPVAKVQGRNRHS